jgi:ABC-type nickel/cobalt efflux system permease component RcnA
LKQNSPTPNPGTKKTKYSMQSLAVTGKRNENALTQFACWLSCLALLKNSASHVVENDRSTSHTDCLDVASVPGLLVRHTPYRKRDTGILERSDNTGVASDGGSCSVGAQGKEMTCTTHHHACECREAEHAQRIATLITQRDELLAAMVLIESIADGSRTVNSLPHLAKLAKAAIEKATK